MSTTVTIPLAAAQKYAAAAVEALPGGFGSLYSSAFAAQQGIALGAPTPSSVTPATGAATAGVPLTIAGKGFVSGAASEVDINGEACTSFAVVDDATITCTTPTDLAAATYDVVVKNADGALGTLLAAYTTS